MLKTFDSGVEHIAAITNEGTVVCWGENTRHQLDPIYMEITNAKELVCSNFGTLVLTEEGTLKYFGYKNYSIPESMNKDFSKIFGYGTRFLALKNNNTTILSIGEVQKRPFIIKEIPEIILDIVCSDNYTVVHTITKNIYYWEKNGDIKKNHYSREKFFPSLDGFGEDNFFIVDINRLYAKHLNHNKYKYLGTFSMPIKDVSGSLHYDTHIIILLEDGTFKTISNIFNVPEYITTDGTIQTACNGSSYLVLKSSGELFYWGYFHESIVNPIMTDVVYVLYKSYYILVLKTDGNVYKVKIDPRGIVINDLFTNIKNPYYTLQLW